MILDQLQTRVDAQPDAVAIVDGDLRLTYATLRQRIDAKWTALADRGVGQGTRVLTLVDNSADALVELYALAGLGARVATVDPTATPHELSEIAADFRPEVVLTESKRRDQVAQSIANDQTLILASESLAHCSEPLAVLPVQHASQQHSGSYLIQYTSGSTGKPKGVDISQRALRLRLHHWIATSGIRPGQSHLCILPLSHGYGNYCVALPALASGGELHMVRPNRATPMGVLNYVQKHRIACIYALPFFYELMTRVVRSRPNLHPLYLAMVGSAPMRSDLIALVQDKLGIVLNNTYGTSETGILTSNLTPNPAQDANAIGTVIEGVHWRVRPVENSSNGGELMVRTEMAAIGYFGSDKPMLVDGWYPTGDLVEEDGSGKLHIRGRISQFVNVGGNKLAPQEVDGVLMNLKGVQECACVGVPDSTLGERLVAFVVRQNDEAGQRLTAGMVRSHCKEALASFKVPYRVNFVPSLPKSHHGKILRTRLVSSTV